jgi:hypothetical protein
LHYRNQRLPQLAQWSLGAGIVLTPKTISIRAGWRRICIISATFVRWSLRCMAGSMEPSPAVKSGFWQAVVPEQKGSNDLIQKTRRSGRWRCISGSSYRAACERVNIEQECAGASRILCGNPDRRGPA